MKKRTIKKILVEGFVLQDWEHAEGGKTRNGGHYYYSYRVVDGVLLERCSYENAHEEKSEYTINGLAKLASSTWNQNSVFDDLMPRWQWR